MADETISVARLSRAQKLRLMETLWEDLSRDDSRIASPPWHAEVLAEREELVRTGKASFSKWSEAKKRLRRLAS